MLNKEKLNANAVGDAAHSDPQTNKTTKFDCRGRRLCPPENKQNGITLIALIITIIVMLILVGVTINVALNGGVFNKADEATRLTQKEIDKETLQVAVIAGLNQGLKIENKQAIQNNLPNGWNVTGTDGGPYTCTSPKGNKFTVDVNGKITEGEKENTPPAPVLPEGLTVGSEFEMDADQDGTEETWIVLYLNENEIEVISKNTMGEDLALGKTDTEAIENATDINGNGTVEDIEIAIYSYNNAIDRINNYCESLIKIGNLGVRSVGSLPSNPSYKNTEPFAIQNLDKWTDTTAWNTYGVLGGDADTNFNDDYTQMDNLGITISGNTKAYWLATRYVEEYWNDSSSIGSVIFIGRYMSASGDGYDHDLWSVNSRGSTNTSNSAAYAVRPVVKLQYP